MKKFVRGCWILAALSAWAHAEWPPKPKGTWPAAPKEILDYRPSGTIPKLRVELLLKKTARKCIAGEDTYCLFDPMDSCALRNASLKSDLIKKDFDVSQATTTILILPGGCSDWEPAYPQTWLYHSVSVVYTEQGPFVFDPSLKHPDDLRKSDFLIPLNEWFKTPMPISGPCFMMIPPGFVNPVAFRDALADVDPQWNDNAKFLERFRGKTPNDPILSKLSPKVTLPEQAEKCRYWVSDEGKWRSVDNMKKILKHEEGDLRPGFDTLATPERHHSH